MTIKNVKAGTIILAKGEYCNKIFIVIEGSLKKVIILYKMLIFLICFFIGSDFRDYE